MMKPLENQPLWLWFVALGLIAIYLGQSWTSMVDKSSTYDEQVYVLAGYGLLETGEYSLKQDAPPLIPLLSAMAIKVYEFLGNEVTLSEPIKSQFDEIQQLWSIRSIDSAKEYTVATEFFHENEGPTLIQVARIPITLLGALLALYLFRFATVLFGPYVGLGVLLFYVIDPNLIGHGRVVSADIALACFFLISHYYLYRCLTETGWGNVVALSIAAAICISVKLSGLLVLPSLLILIAVVMIKPPVEVIESLAITTREFRIQTMRKAVLSIGLLFVFGYIILSLLYQDWNALFIYYKSTQLIYSNVPDGYTSFLMGEFKSQFWFYYIVALVLKSPISTMLLFFLSLWWFRAGNHLAWWFIVIPIWVVMTITTMDSINIGLRRVLLVLPFVFLSLGGLMVFAWSPETASNKQKLVKTMVLLGMMWAIWVGYQIFPHHLSFFTQVIGGPSQGYKYLAESNVSWGQNLPALSRFLKQEGVAEIYMHLYGNDHPDDYGIKNLGFDDYHVYWPIQGFYVVSAHSLIQFSKTDDTSGNWFDRFEPVAVIDHTLFVFDLREYPFIEGRTPERSLEIAESFIAEKKWGSAIPHLQNYLTHFPGATEIHNLLSKVAKHLGHQDLASHHLRLASKRKVAEKERSKDSIESEHD
ncbi:MAG: glycosyltransferase family 39 protein [Planctomycetota bacterium]